jgi:hypothetical protein
MKMNQQEQQKIWEQLGFQNSFYQESKVHMATLARNAYGPIAGYFNNTMVLRDDDGDIVQMINYHADFSMRVWRDGEWSEGTWLINNGKGASIIMHTREVDGKLASWRHPFAAYKTVGDRWISPETSGGGPTFSLYKGGIPIIYSDGKLVVEGTDSSPGAMFSIEEGFVEPPKELAKPCALAEERIETFMALGNNPDKAMEGYFGNTMVMRDPENGKLNHLLIYRPDHTVSGWFGGHWAHGHWRFNNAQDNSILFQTRADMYGCKASWSHPFAPYKKLGDRWITPEVEELGAYPVPVGGIPVVIVNGKSVISGTETVPFEVVSLEEGIVSPE